MVSSSPLSASERKDLVRLARAGDRAAGERLILGHIPLARQIARRMAGKGVSVPDMTSSGIAALIQALALTPSLVASHPGKVIEFAIRHEIRSELRRMGVKAYLPGPRKNRKSGRVAMHQDIAPVMHDFDGVDDREAVGLVFAELCSVPSPERDWFRRRFGLDGREPWTVPMIASFHRCPEDRVRAGIDGVIGRLKAVVGFHEEDDRDVGR